MKQSFCVWRGKKRLWRQICYKKAEKRKRICCVKRNLVGRTHRLIFKTSSSNTTTILDPNCYIFCAPIVPLCKLEIFTVKALHYTTHCFGEAMQIRGCRSERQTLRFIFHAQSFASNSNICNVEERLWCNDLHLEQENQLIIVRK